MKAVAILFVCFSLLGLPAAAHQCILEGSSAGEIQAYNTCKADLASGNAHHAAQDNEDELARLEAENDALKARLADVRRAFSASFSASSLASSSSLSCAA